METLLELVEGGEVVDRLYDKTDESLERAVELESMGFSKLSQDILKEVAQKEKLSKISEYKYVEFTEGNINEFLQRKVDKYNKVHEKKKEKDNMPYPILELMELRRAQQHQLTTDGISLQNPVAQQYLSEAFSKRTCDYMSTDKDTIGQYLWKETVLEEYPTLPPEEVLNKLKLHQKRNVFDYFTIASVEGIPDPLLLGRIENNVSRFFIAQWGRDICLDDVI